MKLKVREQGIKHISKKVGKVVSVDSIAEFENPDILSEITVQDKTNVVVDGVTISVNFLEIAQNFEVEE